jgi:uncharacterized protein YdeI (YjbR/CyaY-like superfamily)
MAREQPRQGSGGLGRLPKEEFGQKRISYPEAVDEALCYGWIDGVRKGIDEIRYANRFTPRTARSNWSAVNVKRVGELKVEGRMRPSGLAAFEARSHASTQYSYELGPRQLDALRC